MISERVSVHLALLLCSIIYGMFYAVIKLLLKDIDEWTFIYLRLTGSAIVLAVLEWGFRRTRFQCKWDAVNVFGLGVVGIFIVQFLFIFGVHGTSSIHAALIMSTIPMLTLCGSLLLKREVFSVQKLLGALIAFTGVAWLIVTKESDNQAQSYPWWGDGLICMNALCFSVFLLGMQPLLKRYRPLSLIAYCYIWGALLFDGLGLMGLYPITWFPKLSLSGWGLVVFTVFFASIGTYGLNNYALARTKPSTVAVYIFMQPLLAALVGHFILQEHFTMMMALSGGVSLFGLYIANKGRSIKSD